MLAAFGADYDESDSTDEGDAAEDWRDGDGAGLLVLDVERAELGVLVFVSEAEATDYKTDDADEDQDEADDGGGFHGVRDFS